MKKISVVVIAMLAAGCAGMGSMDSSGYRSGSGGGEAGSGSMYRSYNPAFDPNFTG